MQRPVPQPASSMSACVALDHMHFCGFRTPHGNSLRHDCDKGIGWACRVASPSATLPAPDFSRPLPKRSGFPIPTPMPCHWRLIPASSLRECARGRAPEQFRDRGYRREPPLPAMIKMMRITCTCRERRSESSPALGHDRTSRAWSRLILPSRCLIFSAVEKCRQPGARSATRGMYGNAMTVPSSRRTPCLRARFSGEPAINWGM
jgi:hypothetical protein